jgi:hypothetical protein
MQIGVDSFAASMSDPASGLALKPVERMQDLLEEIELADLVGLDVFGVGEHHRQEFYCRGPRLVRRVIPAFRLAAGRLRFTVRRKIGASPKDSRKHERPLVGEAPRRADGSTYLSAAGAGSTADLGWRWRHAWFFLPEWFRSKVVRPIRGVGHR